MKVSEFVKSVFVATPVPENVSYVRHLKSVFAQKPYLTNVTWKDDMFVLNVNRKNANFEKYPELNEMNGIIMQVPANMSDVPDVLAYSFNTIHDYVESMADEFRQNWEDYVVEPIVDGSIIRVWYNENEWHVSTIKCVDACDANWSNNRSFYDLFNDACKEMKFDIAKLNQNYCYTFVLGHPENHMIRSYEKPVLFHLNTTDRKNNFVYVTDDSSHVNGIEYISHVSFDSFDELLKRVNAETGVLNANSVLGYTLLNRKTNNKYKLETSVYRRARELKGNVPNVRYRIIELLQNNQEEEFLSFFPFYKDDVSLVKKRMDGLVAELFTTYKANKNENTNPQDLRVHCNIELYWIAREEGYLNYERVKRFVNAMNVMRVGILIRIPYLQHMKFHNGRKLEQSRPQYIYKHNSVLSK